MSEAEAEYLDKLIDLTDDLGELTTEDRIAISRMHASTRQ